MIAAIPEIDNWAEAEIDRLKTAIRKLESEKVPDLPLIAGYKRVLAAIEKLQRSASLDRRYMPGAIC